MLKFIDENDYTLVDTWKENEDGSISWSYNDGTAQHSGIIREGFTRTDGDTTVDVWATLQAKITSGAVTVESIDTDHMLAQSVRQERDFKLVLLDKVLMNPLRWGEFSDEDKEAFAVYRQALLDVPQQSGFPGSVLWPELTVVID